MYISKGIIIKKKNRAFYQGPDIGQKETIDFLLESESSYSIVSFVTETFVTETFTTEAFATKEASLAWKRSMGRIQDLQDEVL